MRQLIPKLRPAPERKQNVTTNPELPSFSEVWQEASEELRYRLDERAAVQQFDGGLSREEAEKRTVEAWLESRRIKV